MEKWTTPAAERNKGPILEVLTRVLPARGLALEIASGTGQHVVHFAKSLSGWTWQPSDPDPEARESIALRVAEAQLPNLRAPLELDVCQLPWPVPTADAVVCINMIHIAPWRATRALFEGAQALLQKDCVLLLYGPYRRLDRPTAPSNEQFDADLRARDPEWGLRNIEAVSEVAHSGGFALTEIVDMPANNLSLVFKKA
jgi:SAM-dependent methyltransferase